MSPFAYSSYPSPFPSPSLSPSLTHLQVGSWWAVILPIMAGAWSSFPITIYTTRRIAMISALSITIVIFGAVFDGYVRTTYMPLHR